MCLTAYMYMVSGVLQKLVDSLCSWFQVCYELTDSLISWFQVCYKLIDSLISWFQVCYKLVDSLLEQAAGFTFGPTVQCVDVVAAPENAILQVRSHLLQTLTFPIILLNIV